MDNVLLHMQSYLYVEEKLRGQPTGSYVLRYFILHPYCGLHWFEDKPEGILNGDYMEIGTSGWVYGGNISVDRVTIENVTVLQQEQIDIYPFVLTLRCEDDTIDIRFATEEDSTRQTWVEEIEESAKLLKFIASFCKLGALPSRRIYNKSCGISSLHLTDTALTEGILHAIIDFVCANKSDAMGMKLIEFNHCHLNDSHAPALTALLENVNLEGLVLACNNFQCKAIAQLAPAICANTKLEYLDLSSNLIGDKGMDALASAIVCLPKLTHFNISRNRLTERAVRALTMHLSRHTSALKELNLSYNQIGDSVAAVVSLLMYNQPSHLESFDISYCSVKELGLKEISTALLNCTR